MPNRILDWVRGIFNTRQKQILLLAIVTLAVTLFRFAHMYPDSEKYLQHVDYFLGIASSPPPSPFSYRFALPLLVAGLASIGGNPLFIFSVLSMILSTGTTIVLYLIIELHAKDSFDAFLGALVGAVSLPVAFYGGTALVDPGAMLVIGLLIYFSEKQEHKELLYVLLPLGVCFKEIVLFTGIYLLVKWKLHALPPLIIAGSVHLAVRFVYSGDVGHIWMPSLFNVLENTLFMLFMLVGGLGIPGLIFLFRLYKGTIRRDSPVFTLFLFGVISFIPLFLLGMFFAYFDARFIWPFYFPLLAICFARAPDESST